MDYEIFNLEQNNVLEIENVEDNIIDDLEVNSHNAIEEIDDLEEGIVDEIDLEETSVAEIYGLQTDGVTTTIDNTIPNYVRNIARTDINNWNDAYSKEHTHDNKEVLDNTTASFTVEQATKLQGLSNYNDTAITGRVSSIEGTLPSKANISDIPTKTSQLTNDSGFLTSHQSLSDYYTKEEADDLLDDKADAEDIPTKTSELTNDSGYLTSHQSLSGYATEQWVYNQAYLTEHQSLSNYYTKAQANALLDDKADVDDIPDVSGKANTNDLSTVAFTGDYDDLINKPSSFGNVDDVKVNGTSVVTDKVAEIDLTDYAKIEDVPTVPTALSGFTDDLGSNPTHTHSQYLTSHQDISGKADRTELKNAVRFEAELGNNYTLISTDADYETTVEALEDGKLVYIAMTNEGVEDGVMYPTEHKTQMDDKYVSFVYHFRKGHEINEVWLHVRESGNNNTEWRIIENAQMKRTHTTGWNAVPSDDYYPSEWLVVDTLTNFQKLSEKVQSVINNSTSEVNYPSTKAVYSEFIPRPVEIFNKNDGLLVEGTLNEAMYVQGSGLTAVQTISQTVSATQWNITGANFKPFKSLKVVYVRDDTNTGTTAEFRIPLEYPIKSNAYFSATGQSLSFGDRNRANVCQCVVNGSGYAEGVQAKSQFCFLNGASLYGTAYTPVANIYITKIYGCYD